jgi:DNA-binding winged helix-turn-helix (wHTH) protein
VIEVERHLVGRERMLLGLMIRRFGRVVTHDDLIVTMWPDGIEPDAVGANMRVRISRIRRAIKKVGAPWIIRSEFALGYRLYEVTPEKK